MDSKIISDAISSELALLHDINEKREAAGKVAEDWEREFDSGVVATLWNLTETLATSLGITDHSQWSYDCGWRVCGTPQVGVCDYCKTLGIPGETNE
jgi:hypothetical protein